MKRTIWLQFAVLIVLSLALLVDEHIIRAQAAQLHRMAAAMVDGSNAMTQARHALRVQGDALDECIKSVYPRLREPPVKRPTMFYQAISTRVIWR